MGHSLNEISITYGNATLYYHLLQAKNKINIHYLSILVVDSNLTAIGVSLWVF